MQFDITPFPITETPLGNNISFKLLQPEKAYISIVAILSGMLMACKLIQFSKVYLCIVLSFSGKFIVLSREHPEKAFSPISSTLAGISKEDIMSQALKAAAPIFFIVLGNLIEVILFLSHVRKAASPIDVTTYSILL